MFTRAFLGLTWREVRPYVVFSALLFFAGIIVGGVPDNAPEWLRSQMKGMAELAERTRQSEHPQIALFWLILVNNVTKSVVGMYMGVAAGILPVVMLVANGMIIGFLFGGIADEGANVWPLVAKGILPHGILELPALFLACGFGIRLGFTLLRGILGSAFGKDEPWGAFTRTAKGSIPALLLITLMLLVAAIIESTITYRLVAS